MQSATADQTCVVNPVVLAEFAWTLARVLTSEKTARSRHALIADRPCHRRRSTISHRASAAQECACRPTAHGKADSFRIDFLAAINLDARLRLDR